MAETTGTKTTGEIDGTKKIVIIIVVSALVLMGILGVFIPEARTYITSVASSFMGFTQGILK